MTELRKFLAPEFVMGPGARELAGRYAQNLGGSRILLVSDEGVRHAGWVASVARSLEAQGLAWTLFDRVSPNPRREEIMAGASLLRRQDCDLIVAVGGGSPMDCAKGIAVVAANGGEIQSFEGVDEIERPGPPLICIPTTGGSAADVTQFAIINDPEERRKFAIISRKLVPDVSLIDFETLATAAPFLRACTGMDALTHAVEALVSNAGSPLTDLHALEATRLVAAYLEQAVHMPDDTAAQEGMMRASLHAGLAFSNASLGAVHALAHSLGGFLDLPHGLCNAILLPQVVAFNYASAARAYDAFAENLGLELLGLSPSERLAALTRRLRDLQAALGIPPDLASQGVRTGDVKHLAAKAMRDPCLVTNPRPPTQDDLEAIYESAL